MTITVNLAEVPVACWWWTGVTVYLLFCYLLIGPYYSRKAWRSWKVSSYNSEWPPPELVWVFSPLACPIIFVCRVIRSICGCNPLCWLIYGSDE